MTEQNFALGRRAPKNAPALPFKAIRSVVPQYPPSFDSIAGLTNWQMLGNNSAGDCVSVTWATIRRIVTSLRGNEVYPTQDQVWTLYKTQNPDFDPNGDPNVNGPGSPADRGMDIQTLLELLVKEGGPDGVKALAFAKVDHRNLDDMKAALSHFNFLWLGVIVTSTNQQEFPSTPWTYSPGTRPLGGHSITGTGYDPEKFLMETWAAEAALTKAFVEGAVEEAWIVIWPEDAAHLTQAARDALDQAYAAVTGGQHISWGDVPPAPEPTPTPEPAPVPNEKSALEKVIEELKDAMDKLVEELKNIAS